MPSKIDWLAGGDTVNFFTGCNGPHGRRCRYCYAERMANRLSYIEGTVYRRVGYRAPMREGGRTGYTAGDNFYPALHLDVWDREVTRLERARKPRRVFVGSMGDLCFEGPSLLFDANGHYNSRIDTQEVQRWTTAFAGRVAAAGHTVLLLTKRPDLLSANVDWPANVHLGVSVAGDNDAGRITELQVAMRQIQRAEWPAVLWASVEPLLDPGFDPDCLAGLDWVVVGFQTGPGTRPLYPIHAVQRIRDWCADRGVPLFCKDTVRRVLSRETWPREYPPITGEDA
jgi:protein gp37